MTVVRVRVGVRLGLALLLIPLHLTVTARISPRWRAVDLLQKNPDAAITWTLRLKHVLHCTVNALILSPGVPIAERNFGGQEWRSNSQAGLSRTPRH